MLLGDAAGFEGFQVVVGISEDESSSGTLESLGGERDESGSTDEASAG
jgi:hypothetical protein